MLSHYLLWGNGYAEIDRGLDNRAVWLWPLPPDSTMERSETGALVLRVRTSDGKTYVIPRERVFHLADGSYDGIQGASRIELARRSIGAGMAQDVFTAAYYQNGASIGGVLENKGKTLSVPAVKMLLDTFNNTYAGPDRAQKTLYVDGGIEYKPVSLPLADAQFLETRRFQVEEIARWFGVPLHLLQDLSDANYAISYEASKNFVEHTLRPIAVLAEQEANVRLFGLRSQGTIYSRINLSGLMRADPRTRGEYYRSMVNAGVMSINEVRELEELNSIGSDGDEHYMQLNMTTVKRIAEGESVKPPAAAPAPAAEDEPQPENVIRREALTWWRNQQDEADVG
jgi:HK97 family phage portal protein